MLFVYFYFNFIMIYVGYRNNRLPTPKFQRLCNSAVARSISSSLGYLWLHNYH